MQYQSVRFSVYCTVAWYLHIERTCSANSSGRSGGRERQWFESTATDSRPVSAPQGEVAETRAGALLQCTELLSPQHIKEVTFIEEKIKACQVWQNGDNISCFKL